ncbi:acyl-CoA thioesterase [Bacillus sp. 28A-2]|uniref:acyl-CoA thioesterase n=1 Tax=Bacillus sp. 28A-2 TaxID=2772252 RepID=UPI00168CBE0A|nr:thioesterase family protein [Bacillus sp. 28A-2]MBD3860360.1 acyl-CoA thioesterase [Bacillus sp. 28A-2]
MRLPSYIEEPFEEWRASFRFYVETTVRFSETDMFGHMNNVTPFVYFEEARIAFFQKTGLVDKRMKRKRETITVVANLQCDYIKQVEIGERLRVYVKPEKVGSSSLILHYLGENEQQEPCFTGAVTMVQIDKRTSKPVPFAVEEKEVFKLYIKV